MSLLTDQNVIALFGSTGMAGTAISFNLKSRGFNLKEIPRHIFEIGTDPISKLDLKNINFVVNASGVINRREQQPGFNSEAEAVNHTFPLELADLCQEQNIPLIQISTDCVFDGTIGQYFESAPATATSIYGTSKLRGEPKNAMVLRLSMVGPESQNHYSLLCWFLQQQKECNGFTDHLWNGISTLQLGTIIGDIIENKIYKTGLYHIHSTDLSKYELLELFKQHFHKDIMIHPLESGHPKDMRLRTEHTDFLQSLKIPATSQQIENMVRFSNNLGHWQHEHAI